MTFDQELVDKSPFLRLLPPEAMPDLMQRMKQVHYDFGNLVVSEGDPSDAFFLLTSGRARVLKTTQAGNEAPLQRLRRGDSFGEIGLLSGGPRTATVRASEPTDILKLERDDFESLIAEYPQMKEFVELQLQNRMLQGFLQQYTRFARTPLPVLQRILQFLKPVTFSKGDLVIKENDPGGAVYIVEQGKLIIYRGEGEEKRVLAYLRPGDYFGELSLLQGMKRSATVEAATDCKLHCLAPEDWESVLQEYTELREMVQEKIAAYENAATQTREPLDFSQAPENLLDDGDEPEDDTDAQAHETRLTTKFKFVRQIDDNDCGVAGLSMICRHYGKDVGTTWLRNQIGTGRDGSSAQSICDAAKDLGLNATLSKRVPGVQSELPVPSMLHFRGDHWTVCIDQKGDKIKIADPAEGVSWLTVEELGSTWSGHLIEFDPSQTFDDQVVTASTTWQWLTGMFKTNLGKVALAAAVMALVALGESMLPIFAKLLIDSDVDPIERATEFQSMILTIGGIFVGILALLMFQRSVLSKATLTFDKNLHDYVLKKILKLPILYFLQRSPADLQRRLSGVREIRNLITIKGMSAFNAGIQLVVFTGVMFFLNWKLTFAFLAIMLLVYIALIVVSGKILRPAYESLHEMDVSFAALQNEIIQGIIPLKASGREEDFKHIILRNVMQLDRKQVFSFFNVSIFNGITESVWIAAAMIFLWVIGVLSTAVVISTGTLVGLIVMVVLMYSPVQALVNFWADLQSASLLFDRLKDVIEWPSEQGKGDEALRRATSLNGKIEFREVTIQHSTASPPSLADVSFTAMPGQTVAIVGRSGAGKTVLIQTVASLLHPASGTVSYDDVPATEIQLQDLRRQIGLVMTHNRIFSGTIKSNVAFGIQNIDDARVLEVCRKVGISELIGELPDGIDTVVEDDAHYLSGAFRQGIALARALYTDPAILVLDQISGDLDVETESSFFEHLSEVFRDRTVFLATKKISLARTADVILVLEKGQLVEMGNHDDLMVRRGLYYHMASRREG